MALTWKDVEMTIDGIDIVLATVHREGPLSPILLLHGFGSTKEDYLDICMQKEFDGRPFLAYDTPGSGSSTCRDLSRLSVPFLVATARAGPRSCSSARGGSIWSGTRWAA